MAHHSLGRRTLLAAGASLAAGRAAQAQSPALPSAPILFNIMDVAGRELTCSRSRTPR